MKRAMSNDLRRKDAGRPTILALEPRFMFDGAAVDTAVTAIADGTPDAAPKAEPRTAEPQAKQEIAFIDGGVTDWQVLAEGMRDGVEVHVLDADRDGLQQIAEVLKGRGDFDAIHIVSHGAEGQVQMGSAVLSLADLDVRRSELGVVGQSLSADGDILLYGCDVAQGATGSAFTSRLGLLTGADVAASTDITGLSGDWTLEHGTGSIEASVAISDAAQAAYAHSLELPAGGGGTDGVAYGRSVAVDGSGNVYTVGRFNNTIDLDPGAGVANQTSAGGDDIFIQKFDSTGALLWARAFGGTGSEVANGITVDADGNVYTIGNFSGTVDFDPESGVAELSSTGSTDVFVQKLDTNGALVWAKAFGGTSSEDGRGIAVDDLGNVYTTGIFWGTTDLDPGAGIRAFTSKGNNDFFIQKLDSYGTLVWAKTVGGTSGETSLGIAVDADHNVYTTGYFGGTVDFDPGTGTNNLVSPGSSDAFVLKLDANGAYVWAQATAATSNVNGNAIAVDGASNVYVTGVFQGTVDFDPGAGTSNLTSLGNNDIFIQKLNADGTLAWANALGATGIDTVDGIAVDGDGNVYTTGSVAGTADFDPGPGVMELTGSGNDIYVQKLASDGTLAWAGKMVGPGGEYGKGIAVDGSGNMYVTGEFFASVDFDPGAGTAIRGGTASTAAFVEKLDSTGALAWVHALSSGVAESRKTVTDAAGNVYTIGVFKGTVDFDPGAGTAALNSPLNNNIFIQKVDSTGALVWVKGLGENSYDQEAHGLAVDDLGNVYVTGSFRGTVDFDPGAGTTELIAMGTSKNIFIVKLDTAGDLVWARSMGGGPDSVGRGIAVDGNYNVYTIGDFQSSIDFDPGAGVASLSSSGNTDVFVQKLDSTGALVWARKMGGAYTDYGYDIAVDGNENVYTTGSFYHSGDFDPGAGVTTLTSTGNYNNEIFVQKLDIDGNLVWARAMGGSSDDAGKAIALDGSGNVYITGYFSNAADFDPGVGTTSLTSAGGADIFVEKLDTDGALVWVGTMGGSYYDYGNDITVDGSGNVYTTGYFAGTADFDPGAGTNSLTSAGQLDIFLQKLDATGALTWARAIGGTGDDVGNGIAVAGSGQIYYSGKIVGTVDFAPGAETQDLIGGASSNYFVSTLLPSGYFSVTASVTDATTNEDTRSSAGLVITSEDGAATHFKITNISGGTLYKNDGVTEITEGSFITVAEGNAGLKFTPTADSTANGSFDVQLSTSASDAGLDGSAVSATITITPVNDAPALSGDMTLAAVAEDTTEPAGETIANLAGQVSFTDVDDGATLGGFAIIGNTADAATQGTWQYSTDGTTWHAVGSVADGASALALLAATKLRFVPATDYVGAPPPLAVRALDNSYGAGWTSGASRVTVDTTTTGGTTAIAATARAVGTSVTAVNDAPALSGDMTLAAVAEDTAAPAGETIATLAGQVTFTDVDASSSLGGLAIIGNTANAATQGIWQYSTDGTTWHAVGSVADGASALALSAATKLRFVPATDYVGTPPALSVRALDNSYGAGWTSGASRITVDTTTTGGTTAIAATARSVGTSVTAVNDAPALSGDMTLAAVAEDTAAPTGETIATLAGQVSFTDVDASSSLGGFAIIGNTADAATQGIWQYSTDGTTWHAVGSVADGASALALSAATKLRFVPATDYVGTPPALSVRALDNSYGAGWTSGASRVTVDTTTTGGTTAIAATARSVGTSVTAVNDAPVISQGGTTTATMSEGIGTGGYSTSAYVLPSFSVTDGDATGFDGAELVVTIPAGQTVSGDYLSIANVNGVTYDSTSGAVSYNGNQVGTASLMGGVLTVSFSGGNASQAAVETVAKSVVFFSYNQDDPTAQGSKTTRAITTRFSDGGNSGAGGAQTSNTVTTTVTVTAVNDQATLSATPNASFTEGGSAAAPFAAVTMTDVDGSHFNGGSLSLTLDAFQANDVLSIADGNGITVSGGTIRHNGLIIGTVTGGDGTPLSVTFTTTDATLTAVGTLVEQLRFANSGDDPTVKGTEPSRVATLTWNDGGQTGTAAANGTATSTITLSGVNDTPTAVLSSGSAAVLPGSAGGLVDAALTLTDADSTTLDQAVITLSPRPDGSSEVLKLSTAAQTAATNGGLTVMAFDSDSGRLVITGTASVAEYQAVLRGIEYANTAAAPDAAPRTVSVVVRDAQGASSSAASRTVQIDAPPQLGGATAGQTLTDKTTVTPFAGFIVSDANTSQMQSVTVTLDSAAKGRFTTLAGFTDNNDGSYSFTGTAAEAQAAIRQLVFTPAENRGAVGTAETTTFTVSVSDGANATVSNSTTTTAATSVNDTPVAVGTLAGAAWDGDGGSLTIPASAFNDVDPGTILAWSATGMPSWMSFDAATHTLSGKPPVGTSGSTVVSITVNDGNGGTATQTVSMAWDNPPPPAPPSPPSAPPPPPAAPAAQPAPVAGDAADTVTVVRAATAPVVTFTPPPAPSAIPAGDAGITDPGFRAASSGTAGIDGLVATKPVVMAEAAGGQINFTLPGDTFSSNQADAQVQLQATLGDGQALPGWLFFNPQTGTFVGQPPLGASGEIVLRVVARDRNGAEAVATVRINLSAGDAAGRGNGQGAAPAQDAPQAPDQSGEVLPDGDAPINKLAELSPGEFAGKPSFQNELRMASRLTGARQAQLLAAARSVARNA